MGDGKYLKKIIRNLLNNALKFTPKGESVTVHFGIKNKKAELSVIDTGIGIADDAKDQIFTRFFQAENSYSTASGSGVGLAFSQEIAQLHGGNLSFTSQLHQGSTFLCNYP